MELKKARTRIKRIFRIDAVFIVDFVEHSVSKTMLIHEEITQEIIRCFFHVYNYFGYGFSEKVYENALCIELAKAGLVVKAQRED